MMSLREALNSYTNHVMISIHGQYSVFTATVYEMLNNELLNLDLTVQQISKTHYEIVR